MWMLLLSAQMLSPEPHTVIGTMACRNVLYLEKCQQSWPLPQLPVDLRKRTSKSKPLLLRLSRHCTVSQIPLHTLQKQQHGSPSPLRPCLGYSQGRQPPETLYYSPWPFPRRWSKISPTFWIFPKMCLSHACSVSRHLIITLGQQHKMHGCATYSLCIKSWCTGLRISAAWNGRKLHVSKLNSLVSFPDSHSKTLIPSQIVIPHVAANQDVTKRVYFILYLSTPILPLYVYKYSMCPFLETL